MVFSSRNRTVARGELHHCTSTSWVPDPRLPTGRPESIATSSDISCPDIVSGPRAGWHDQRCSARGVGNEVRVRRPSRSLPPHGSARDVARRHYHGKYKFVVTPSYFSVCM